MEAVPTPIPTPAQTNQPGTYDLTQEEVQLAASQEETMRLEAENETLRNRIVLLRALANRLEKDLHELKQAEGQETDTD